MVSFSYQARLLKRLGHPTRLRLLWLLRQDEACVCHLAAALRISQPAVSQHLMALRRSGAVSRRREGKNIYYRLSGDEIAELLDQVARISGSIPDPASLSAAAECPCPRCQAGLEEAESGSAHSKGPLLWEPTGEKLT